MVLGARAWSGWRGWLASGGLVVGCYGAAAVLGWFQVSGGAHSTLEDQPVSSWLIPVGMGSGVLGAAAIWIAYRTAPPLSHHTPEPPRWFLPALLGGMLVASVLGTVTASLAAPHSLARWAPLPILGLAVGMSAWMWFRQRSEGSD